MNSRSSIKKVHRQENLSKATEKSIGLHCRLRYNRIWWEKSHSPTSSKVSIDLVSAFPRKLRPFLAVKMEPLGSCLIMKIISLLSHMKLSRLSSSLFGGSTAFSTIFQALEALDLCSLACQRFLISLTVLSCMSRRTWLHRSNDN